MHLRKPYLKILIFLIVLQKSCPVAQQAIVWMIKKVTWVLFVCQNAFKLKSFIQIWLKCKKSPWTNRFFSKLLGTIFILSKWPQNFKFHIGFYENPHKLLLYYLNTYKVLNFMQNPKQYYAKLKSEKYPLICSILIGYSNLVIN